MKRWVRAATYLYPASWRRRYAAEFDAMLDAVDTQWQDVFDVLKGALIMQFNSWNLKSITLTFAAIGAVLAAVTAFSIPAKYQSRAVLRMSVEGAPSTDLSRQLGPLAQEVLSRTSLERVVVGLDLYKEDRKSRPFEDIVQDMRRDITISIVSRKQAHSEDSGVFSIAYRYPDPVAAQSALRQMVTDFIDYNFQQRAHAGPQIAGNLEILDPASNPQQPISPHKVPVILAGLFAGVLIGLTVSYVMRWRIVIVRRSAQ